MHKALTEHVTCSCCGHRSPQRKMTTDTAWSIIKAGWRSYGSVIYCPKCVATWHERNNKELNGKWSTFEMIMDYYLARYESATTYEEGDWI